MARAARATLADARALEEQNLRQQMHGGAFYGAGMRVGGGATPSMGLSQFRGGRCHKCGHDDCDCSDSDEEMEGGGLGSWVGSLATGYRSLTSAAAQGISRGATSSAAAARAAAQTAANARAAATASSALRRSALTLTDAPTSSALTVYRPPVASSALAVRPSGTAASTLAVRPAGASSSTLATRPTGNAAYDIALDLRGVSGTASSAARTTIASRLARMGITPARVAAALAAGVAIGALEAYFQSQQRAGPGGDYIVDWPPVEPPEPPPEPPTRPPPRPPGRPGGPGGDGGDGPDPGDLVPGTPRKIVAAYLRSGNAPARYRVGSSAQRRALAESEGAIYGSGMSGGRRRSRAAVVKRVMAEQGLSLPQASRYVKENGIAY